jgi:hypothetical protein
MRDYNYDISWDDMDGGDYEDYYGGPDDWELEGREAFESGEYSLPPKEFGPDEVPTVFVTDRGHFYEEAGMDEMAFKVAAEFAREHVTAGGSDREQVLPEIDMPF